MFFNLDKINKNKIAAWAVHGFTGSGAVLGFLAIIAILNSNATGAFLFPIWWLFTSILIANSFGNKVMSVYLILCILTIFIRQRVLLL